MVCETGFLEKRASASIAGHNTEVDLSYARSERTVNGKELRVSGRAATAPRPVGKHMIYDGAPEATDAVINQPPRGRQTLSLCSSRRKPDFEGFPSLPIVRV